MLHVKHYIQWAHQDFPTFIQSWNTRCKVNHSRLFIYTLYW